MKTVSKRILSAILTLIMVFMIIPLGVATASAAYSNNTSSYAYPIRTISDNGRGFTSSHKAVDLTIKKGTPVYAAKSGTVVEVKSGCKNNNGASKKSGKDCKAIGCTCKKSFVKDPSGEDNYKAGYYCNAGMGNGIIIKNDDGYYCYYSHLSTISVKKGDKVTQSTKIGEVGSTGCSTGAHLHFAIEKTKNGTNQNPFNYIFPGYKITLTNNGSSSVNPRFNIYFAWKQFTATSCKIYFGTSSSSLNKTSEDKKFTAANCFYDLGKKFGNLTKGKTYYIKVSVTKDGKTFTSSVYSFVAGAGDKTFLNYANVQASENTTATTTYAVTYNANGGSGAPAAQTKTKGKNLTLSSTVPSRSGYTFKGWATSASGSVAYSAGGTYSKDANVTLYAIWSKNTTTSPVLSTNSISLKYKSTTTITETQGLKVTWTTSNAKVAKVDSNGKVTAVGNGDAVITATASNGKTATCNVNVYSTTIQKLLRKLTGGAY